MTDQENTTFQALVVADVSISRDAEGRYCLNDLHRASGGESRHQPSLFLRRPETSDFIKEIVNSAPAQSLIPVVTVEGRHGGTYVFKEIVYAYAMWISPIFHLKVIRAYDALVTGAATKQLTQSQIILLQAQQLVEIEARQAEYEERVRRVEFKQQAIEDGFKYFTVLAYAGMNSMPIDLTTARKLGKKAAALSKDKGQPIDRVRDPRFGMINAYHERILQAIFAEEIG